jgi:serine/threonine protein kinase
MQDLIGHSVGHYHILEQLGKGGMATVYKAFDTHLDRDAAIKFIRKEAFSQEILDRVLLRFDREAKSLARLTHPNIVPISDYGEYDGSPYLVMPYLIGGTLKQFLGKPMALGLACKLLKPIAEALAFAHQKGIVHRDVKPANILLTENHQVMLSDFGIARILEIEQTATLTSTGVGIGTPEYMAPEQGLGREVDGRADIYSLGIIFYELLTGSKPYTADTPMAVVLKQTTAPLPPLSTFNLNLPERVDHILVKALAKDPDNRYQNMAELANVFSEYGDRNSVIGGNILTMGGDTFSTIHEVVHTKTPHETFEKINTISKPSTQAEINDDRSSSSIQVKTGKSRTLVLVSIIGVLVIGAALLGIFLRQKPVAPIAPDLLPTAEPIYVPESVEIVLPTPGQVIPVGQALILSKTGEVFLTLDNGTSIAINKNDLIGTGAGVMIKTLAGTTSFTLPNGSTVFLGENTLLELSEVSNVEEGMFKSKLILRSGQVLSVVTLAKDESFFITNPEGAYAQVTGSIMGVVVDPQNDKSFTVDCLEGHCQMSSSQEDPPVDVPAGQSRQLGNNESTRNIDESKGDYWKKLVETNGVELSLVFFSPTITPGIAPNNQKTRTPSVTPISPGNTMGLFTFTPSSGLILSQTPSIIQTSTSTPVKTATSATQVADCYPVINTVLPAGSGSISVSPAQNCLGGYLAGTYITATISINSGYLIQQWGSPCAASTSSTCSTTVTGATYFNVNNYTCYPATGSVRMGQGSVTILTPPNCGSLYANTNVTFRADPAPGYYFSYWDQATFLTSNPYTKSPGSTGVKAEANFMPTISLNLSKIGSGSISASPGPNLLGSYYYDGTQVTVTASPSDGYIFDHWEGDCSGSGGCSLTMTSNKSVTAVFVLP